MTYVISDLHGYPLKKLKMLLEKANFNDEDELFILGDVIDRNGDGGVEILEWLLTQYNIYLILGNHEAMLLSCEFLFDEITDVSISKLSKEKIDLLINYQFNGGTVTLKALSELNKKSPETVAEILEYLRCSQFYEAVSVGDKDYILVHSGFDNFSKTKKLSEYSVHDLVWAEPELTDEYFDDLITVFGHTPTYLFGDEYKGKIIKTKTWIAIDMGATDGETEPVLLRLDDMAEFRN